MSLLGLPLEILEEIASYVVSAPLSVAHPLASGLWELSLVSRQLTPIFVRALWRRVELSWQDIAALSDVALPMPWQTELLQNWGVCAMEATLDLGPSAHVFAAQESPLDAIKMLLDRTAALCPNLRHLTLVLRFHPASLGVSLDLVDYTFLTGVSITTDSGCAPASTDSDLFDLLPPIHIGDLQRGIPSLQHVSIEGRSVILPSGDYCHSSVFKALRLEKRRDSLRPCGYHAQVALDDYVALHVNRSPYSAVSDIVGMLNQRTLEGLIAHAYSLRTKASISKRMGEGVAGEHLVVGLPHPFEAGYCTTLRSLHMASSIWPPFGRTEEAVAYFKSLPTSLTLLSLDIGPIGRHSASMHILETLLKHACVPFLPRLGWLFLINHGLAIGHGLAALGKTRERARSLAVKWDPQLQARVACLEIRKHCALLGISLRFEAPAVPIGMFGINGDFWDAYPAISLL